MHSTAFEPTTLLANLARMTSFCQIKSHISQFDARGKLQQERWHAGDRFLAAIQTISIKKRSPLTEVQFFY